MFHVSFEQIQSLLDATFEVSHIMAYFARGEMCVGSKVEEIEAFM